MWGGALVLLDAIAKSSPSAMKPLALGMQKIGSFDLFDATAKSSASQCRETPGTSGHAECGEVWPPLMPLDYKITSQRQSVHGQYSSVR